MQRNRSKLSDFETAWWAATKLQASFRGRISRQGTKAKPIARLKAKMGLGLLVMSRIAKFATSRSADFIKEMEEESAGHTAAAILREATGVEAMRADALLTTKHILDGKTLEQIETAKKKEQSNQLEGFEMEEDAFNDPSSFNKDVGSTSSNLFVKQFPIYPMICVQFEAHDNNDDFPGLIVQRSWVEVPPLDKPMRMLRVRQDQLEDATRSVVRHAQGGKSSGVDESGKKEQDQMSEGGFSSQSSQSSLGSDDDLNDLYSEEDEQDEDLELSTNLHDLV